MIQREMFLEGIKTIEDLDRAFEFAKTLPVDIAITGFCDYMADTLYVRVSGSKELVDRFYEERCK